MTAGFSSTSPFALLTNTQTAAADRLAAEAGVPVSDLMQAAGQAVARAVLDRFPGHSVLVLCGPGNNGGDGFVAAEVLAAWGVDVRVACLVDPGTLKGEVAAAAADLTRPIESAVGLDLAALDRRTIIIDALFGAGLNRPLDGVAKALVEALAASGLTIVAVDLPSGVDGDTGQVYGAAAAALTVTFERKKPAHLLYPAKELCGELVVAPIGIPVEALAATAPFLWENDPVLWLHEWRPPGAGDHKYTRGKLAVLGGPKMHGAALLAAQAAMRAGAGLVTLMVPAEASARYAASRLFHIIVKDFTVEQELISELSEARLSTAIIGPGAGDGAMTRVAVEAARARNLPAVIDADALHCGVAAALTDSAVLTPHDGEFARVFPQLANGLAEDRLTAARTAARQTGAVMVLKGAATIIAAPDGRAVINSHAPPWLATAGSGDVLAGFIGGFLAQGMSGFAAACAGVWLHGEAGKRCGIGLVATDLPEAIRPVLHALHEQRLRQQR
jgi:NAD(P)H-hydrate epimerase